jgi:DNA-directed RNA polymerase specialized sigma24 family protein
MFIKKTDQMDGIHEELQDLALEAQKHQLGTQERQLALTKLISKIYRSGELPRPYLGEISPSLYEEIYQEAMQNTLLWICKNIEKYNPQRGTVIGWISFFLHKRCIDVIKEHTQQKVISFERVCSLSSIESDIVSEKENSSIQQIQKFIEEDPENLFQQEHIRNRPEVNFRNVALAYLAGKSWSEISVIFNVSIPTLCSFYQRTLKKFTPRFREYLQN